MYVSISQAKQDGNEYMTLACSCLTDNLLHQGEFLILLFAEQSKAKSFLAKLLLHYLVV